MRGRRPRGRRPRFLPRGRLVVLLDTGPLLERTAEELGAGCASSPGLRELLAKAEKLVAGAEYVATVCPVYVEVLHLFDSRCKGRLRGELGAARSRLARMLMDVKEVVFDLKSALSLISDAAWLDLADAALIVAAEELLGQGTPVALLTLDARLAGKARERGVPAATLWELASLLS